MTVQLTKGYTIPVNEKNGSFLKLYICHFPEHKSDLFHVILWFTQTLYHLFSVLSSLNVTLYSDIKVRIYCSTRQACPYGKGGVLPVNSIRDTA